MEFVTNQRQLTVRGASGRQGRVEREVDHAVKADFQRSGIDQIIGADDDLIGLVVSR